LPFFRTKLRISARSTGTPQHQFGDDSLAPLRHFFSAAPIALAAVTFAVTAGAQVVGSTLNGIVTDTTGAAIANATVHIRNAETGTERNLHTDAGGRYAAPSLSVGVYNVTVEAPGFNAERHTGVSLTVGQASELNISLRVASDTQQVTVTDVAPTVNLSNEQVSGLVNERQVKDLPLNGRSYDQLITLNPATVNYTSQRSGGIGTSNSSVGNMFSVSGRRPQDNLYLLNGIEYTGASLINVTPGGTSGQLLGVEAVREFNVVADTYGASYGKRQGAQISIVTASGTNTLHGSAYEFIRNSALDARNYFDQAKKPNFQRNNFGGALGGPIKHDKLFVFGNYEGYRQNLGLSLATFVPNAASRAAAVPSVQPLLALFPIANGADLGGGLALAYSNPVQRIREDFGTARVDTNLSANDLLFGVYTIDDSIAHTPTSNPLSVIDETLREQVVSVQEQHVFSPRLLNTFRIGYSRASFYFLGSSTPLNGATVPGFVTGKPVGAIVVAGSTASNGLSQLSGGANVGSNNAIARNLYTLDDHIFYTIGKHQIEVGGWLQRLQSNDNLAQNQYGQASFASVATFLQGTIKTFTVVPTPTELNWVSWFGAGYLEDTWKVTPSLELLAGIRFESTNGWNEAHGRAGIYGFTNGVINTNPTVGSAGLPTNNAKFLPEPRVGLAWKVSSDGKTAVRAGFGLHHSLLDNLDYRFDQSAPFNTTLAYSGVPVSNPTGGAAGLISPSNVQPDIATPTLLSYTVKVEREIGWGTSLTIGYQGSRSYDQILSKNQNEPASIICGSACPAGVAAGRIYYPTIIKANPAVANTTSWVSQGTGNYNALTVDLRRSFRSGVQFRANYTWSKNLDNGSAWNTSVSANTPAFVSYPNNPSLDYGRAATDVRNIAAINGTYDLPFGNGKQLAASAGAGLNRLVGGWSVSTIISLQTGLPFSPQLGYNPTGSGDTRNPVRPDINPNYSGSVYNHGSTSQRVAQYFNPNAFLAPHYGVVGNLGRDTLTGPGFSDWDLSLLKSTNITERLRVQFRAEAFNLLNHTNLSMPNEAVFSGGPTQGTAANQTTAVALSPTAGVVTAAATSRQLQFGLKLLF
jgi:hypothetical protein